MVIGTPCLGHECGHAGRSYGRGPGDLAVAARQGRQVQVCDRCVGAGGRFGLFGPLVVEKAGSAPGRSQPARFTLLL